LLGNDGDLRATITNNYFNFVQGNPIVDGGHDHSAVYLEGSQQVVTGNTFVSSLPERAVAAIETHGGRSIISNNTTNYYYLLVNVVATTVGSPLSFNELNPNDIVVANNSITCGQNGIALWPAGHTLRNVSVTGNTIQICNATRGTAYTIITRGMYSGIYTTGPEGNLENAVIANNIILHEPESGDNRQYFYPPNSQGFSAHGEGDTGAILLVQHGNLSNIDIRNNVIKDAPISGIRVNAVAVNPNTRIATNIRVTDNIIVDAGRNHGWPLHDADAQSLYRSAIMLVDQAQNVDIQRNMIYDTGNSTQSNGLFSINAANGPFTNVRTSQNTVRANQGQLLSAQAVAGLVDVTNANEVLISPIQGSTTSLPVNFTSFTQYITTISNFSGSLNVESPHGPSGQQWAQWTIGQVVTFRFLCAVAQGCSVTFDPPYSATSEGAAILLIPASQGRAITFQVENWASDTGTHKFFELYRSPVGVPNP